MDDLGFNILFNSVSVISGLWKGEHERLCAMRHCLGSEIILPSAGLKRETLRSIVGSANFFASQKNENIIKFYRSYDVDVIQWITSCHKNRMTTHYITPGYWRVTS